MFVGTYFYVVYTPHPALKELKTMCMLTLSVLRIY